MPSRRRLFIVTGFLLVVGFIVATAWINAVGDSTFLERLATTDVLWVIPALGLTAISLLLRWTRWQWLLRTAGVRVPARSSFAIYMASLVGRIVPAYLGEMIRAVLMRRAHGTSPKLVIGLWILERLADAIALALLCVIATTPLRHPLFVAATAAVATIGAFAVVLTLARRGRPEPSKALNLAKLLLLSVAAWLPSVPIIACCARAYDWSIPWISSAGVLEESTLLGGASLMPLGVASTGTIAVYRLESLGASVADALVVTSLMRAVTMGFSILVGLGFLATAWRGATASSVHFDDISDHYAGLFTPEMWKLLIERKAEQITRVLGDPKSAGRGLDLGCGLGLQAQEMRRRGFDVSGLENSLGLAKEAHKSGLPIFQGDGTRLGLRDDSLDFIYTIGVLHHLGSREAQLAACREAARVLKPGGRLFVHETNTKNPLFRFYMGYVFPLTKPIDEGTEIWVDPDTWREIPGLELEAVHHFTFLPDFIPTKLLPLATGLERRLERSRFARYSVHYMAVLRRS